MKTRFKRLRIRPSSGRSAFTMIELIVASSISLLVMVGLGAAFLITARSIHETYGQTNTRSIRMRALDQIRYNLAEAQQGVLNYTISNSNHRIEFKDPNLGSGVVSAFWYNSTANALSGEEGHALYYDNDIDDNTPGRIVSKGPIDISFEQDNVFPGSMIKISVKSLAPMSYADVDLQDGITVVYLRNPETI